MRILTWNINGIRTIPQYHPWNTLKNHDEILNKLEADIICFQEMKSSRPILPKDVAIPQSYDSFFSFPVNKSGYSGVATYTRSSVVTPVKAEEGLTGLIQLKPPFAPEERISQFQHYPPQLMDDDDLDFKQLDSEGRAVTVDFGLFVLINVYCPNDGVGTEERDKFKMDYHRLLSERVKGLQQEGREVIVLGDINASAAVIDHCEGNIIVARGKAAGLEGEDGFWEKEYRVWLRDWLRKEDGSGGPFIDIVRHFWPGRKGMYTCWNTKISARETNYGTRIDYILITPGLLPWIKAADVQQDIKGSDHCPVFVDFFDEIISDAGRVIKLQDVIGPQTNRDGKRDPPRLAANFWEEHSGKQTSLHSFFAKNKKSTALSVPVSLTPQPSDHMSVTDNDSPAVQHEQNYPVSVPSSLDSPPTSFSQTPSSSLEPPASSPPLPQSSPPVTTASQPLKRKLIVDQSSAESSSSTSVIKKSKVSEKKAVKKGKDKPGQAKLSAFLIKPGSSRFTSLSSSPSSSSPSATTSNGNGNKKTPQSIDIVDVGDYVEDFSSSGTPNDIPSLAGNIPNGAQVKQVWDNILAPVQPPKCIVHGELTKELTVNKPGPNKGKKFYVCSRPVGPGWDKGKAERLREEVDPTYRCNYFKWSSDWRKQVKKVEPPSSSSPSLPPKRT